MRIGLLVLLLAASEGSWLPKKIPSAPTAPAIPPSTPSAPALVSLNGDYYSPSASPPVPLQWNAVTVPDGHAIQYLVEVWGVDSSYSWTSSWVSGTSLTTPPLSRYFTYSWRVKARDSVDTAYVSGWSSTDTFFVTD